MFRPGKTWYLSTPSPFRTALRFAGLALAVALLLPAAAQEQRQLMVYAHSIVFSVPTTARGGQEFVSLSDVLEPLGNVSARQDAGKWRLSFVPPGGKEAIAEFHSGASAGKVRGQDFSLAANFFIESGRGYIPLGNAGDLVGLLTGQPTLLRQNSGRLFVGNIGIRYSTDLRIGNPPRLVLSFQSPVNPTVATEPGRVRLTFRRDAVISSGPENVSLGNPVIMSTSFNDSTGIPQITVNATAPLTVNFADGNRTLILTPIAVQVQASPPTVPPASPTPAPSSEAGGTASPQPVQGRFLVVIDAAHGGDDRGAAITQNIAEKDVTLALARRLQHELQNRGVAASMVRHGDSNLLLDDRATAANVSQASLYVCIHAANLGTGVRVFTTMMSPAPSRSRAFVPWDSAQAAFLNLSSQAANSVAAELVSRRLPVQVLPAPLRPMRNVAAPAIAIEVSPPGERAEQITAPDYQQAIAAAMAQGILGARAKLAGAR